MLRQRKIRSFRCRKSKKPGFPKSNRRSERPILPKRPVMKKNKPEKSILKIWLKSPKKTCGVPMPRFLIFPAPCSACLSNRLMIFLPAAVSAAQCKSWIFRILSAGAMKTNAAHPASSAMSVWKTALSKWQRKTAISMWSAPLIPSLTPERK